MRLSIVVSAQPASFEAATFQGDLDANLAFVRELGFDGVELAVRDPDALDADALAARLGELDLDVSALGTGQAWGEEGLSLTSPDAGVRRRAVERLEAHVRLSTRLGRAGACPVVIVGLLRGKLAQGQDRALAAQQLVEGLKACCASAAGAGVRIAVEPINRYETDLVNTVAQGLELIEQVGAAELGLLLDTFHMNIEEPDILQSIRRAAGRVFHVHVADSNRHAPGQGHIDFEAVLGALDAIGYRGFASGEFLPLPDAGEAARRALRHLRACQKETG
ncbi:MAG: sugar phosphate isomerase/epimerase [Deltaproteobacteria bacterium]|nr:sugar phosphate isomerase/epimerase [Deltaproteobacteria bacterium]